MFFQKWKIKQTMVHLFHGLLSNKKERTGDMWHNLRIMLNKNRISKKYILHDSTYKNFWSDKILETETGLVDIRG